MIQCTPRRVLASVMFSTLTNRRKAAILAVITVVTAVALVLLYPGQRSLLGSQLLPDGLVHSVKGLARHSGQDGGNSSLTPKRKKIVYSCTGGCGGWADRQKGIVSAYALAAMLNRDFGIHLSFPCELSGLLGVGKVDWRVRPSELIGPGSKHYKRLDFDAVKFTKTFLAEPDLDQYFSQDVSIFTWNMEVVTFLKQHPLASRVSWLVEKPTPEVYERALRDLFVLKPPLQRQLDDLHKSRPPGTQLVCAQVRLGKHNGSFPDVEPWHTFEEFPVLVRFLTKYNDTRKFRVLFASDSVEIVRRAKASFPEVFVDIPGPITHTDKSRGADACAGFQKAVVDEYAMGLCDVLVISESGLGKVASFLRGSDQDLYLFHKANIDPFTRGGTFPNKAGW